MLLVCITFMKSIQKDMYFIWFSYNDQSMQCEYINRLKESIISYHYSHSDESLIY